MCSGGNTSALRAEQTRLANISKIKAKQAARKSKISVVMGGDTKDYLRSVATGAKPVGETVETKEARKISKLFTSRAGLGAAEASRQATKQAAAKKARKSYLELGGGGGGAGGGW